MAQIESAGARQRFLPDHAPGLQPRAGRIHRLVRRGAAVRRIHEGDRHRVARGARGPRSSGPISINVRITAVRKLAVEAADNGLLAPELAAGIARVKGVRSQGVRVGNWLSLRQAQTLLNAPDVRTKKGLRDRAMFAMLLGCGLRRSEADDSHDEAHPAAGRPLVHRGSRRKARTGADDPDADVGEDRDRRVDRGRGRHRGTSVPARQSRRSGLRGADEREGRLADGEFSVSVRNRSGSD